MFLIVGDVGIIMNYRGTFLILLSVYQSSHRMYPVNF